MSDIYVYSTGSCDGKVVPVLSMKVYGGHEVHLFLVITSAVDGIHWLALRSCRFIPGKGPPVPIK